VIEDELRATMSAHDAEAPSATDFRPHVRRDRHVPSIVGAVIVVVLVVAGVKWLQTGRSPVTPTRATGQAVADCPTLPRRADLNLWVPDRSRAPRHSLVPDHTPTSVTLCAYLHDSGIGTPTGGTRLDGNLAAVTTALRAARPARSGGLACTLNASATDFDNYLIRMAFGSAVVWVSAPGSHCLGSTNGRFSSGTNLRIDAAQAYRYGRWDTSTDYSPPGNCSLSVDPHAARTLPPAATSMTICFARTPPGRYTLYRFERAQLDQVDLRLAAKYDRYAARVPPNRACPTDLSPIATWMTVHLDYPDRPDAVVVGDPRCMRGPGGLVLTGAAARQAYLLFALAPTYLH
jgi:hypothetical protein